MATIVISSLALMLSIASFWINSPISVERRNMRTSVRALAAQAIILLDQRKTLRYAIDNDMAVDEYLLSSMRRNAANLLDHIHELLKFDLWPVVVGTQDDTSAILRYTAFTQALTLCGHENSTKDDFTKLHFELGLIRLVADCRDSGILSKDLLQNAKRGLPGDDGVLLSRTYLTQD